MDKEHIIKKITYILILSFGFSIFGHTQINNVQIFENLPDTIPVIFGKGIISLPDRYEYGVGISPNYDELFGISHFVHNNVNGLSYDVYNYNEMAEKIIMLLNNNELYNKLKQNAINDSRNYDWNFISEKYNYILNDL